MMSELSSLNMEQPNDYYWDKFAAYADQSCAFDANSKSIDVARIALKAGDTPQEVGMMLKLGDPNILLTRTANGAETANQWADRILAHAQKLVAKEQQLGQQQPQMDRKQELLKQLDKELDL